jgi:hypothetical protein
MRNVEDLNYPLYIGKNQKRARFNTNGMLTFEGTATAFDDLRVSLFGQRLYSPAGKITMNFTDGTVIMAPSGNIDNDGDVVLLNFQIPHAAKVDSPLRVHIHWFQANTTIRSFTFRYRVLSHGQQVPAWSSNISTSTTIENSVFPYTSGIINQITRLIDIPLVGTGISAIVQIRLTRSDSSVGNIEASFLDAHYEIDSCGSDLEYVK